MRVGDIDIRASEILCFKAVPVYEQMGYFRVVLSTRTTARIEACDVTTEQVEALRALLDRKPKKGKRHDDR